MTERERTRPRNVGRGALLTLAAVLMLLALAGAAQAKSGGTVWLCKPGHEPDPCTTSRTATVVSYQGTTREETLQRSTHTVPKAVDCFYVYPTVSEQEGPNANLEIEPEETQIAVDQASRFSQDCRVFAPMYPQLTLNAINNPGAVTEADRVKAYVGVLSAFEEYLQRFSKGHGFVLIGHSQGSAMLEQLIHEQIDPNPALRARLVSAVILGGNVLVPEGQLVGGTFQNVPACTQAAETGCVIAYSSFAKEPPEGAFFGRPDSPLLGVAPPPGLQVLCVNPTLLNQDGSAGALLPYASTTPFPGQIGLAVPTPVAPTPWVEETDAATAQCMNQNGASWLQVSSVGEPSVQQERFERNEAALETLGPDWGLHLYDVNVALGNLVNTVALQAQTYTFGG